MMTLTGFADEISPELDEQLQVLGQEGICYLELRGVWNKGVAEFGPGDIRRLKPALTAGGFGVSAIGSPIGKIGIHEPHEPHFQSFLRILELAVELKSPYIRLFSYYMPPGDNPQDHRSQVLDRLNSLLEAADGSGVMLLHENEGGIYGSTAERCLDLLQSLDHPNLRAIFDPANFIMEGQKPFSHCYPLLEDYLEYFHIKDAIMAERQVVPSGEGDGEISAMMQALKDRGYKGFLSLEPHLAIAGRDGGFSGPELFKRASRAFKAILDELEIDYA